MTENITLDRETFKTLASGTRVEILKSLDRRRKTLTELSKQFGMSASSVKEHMDNLSRADLVVQIDDGHKWKYYELTKKGKKILHPAETKIWIMLSVSAFAFIGIFYNMFSTYSVQENIFKATGDMAEAAPVAAQTTITTIPFWHILALVFFAGLIGIALGYFLVKRIYPSVANV